jgi:TRAP-type mannitol/chloroaromatic compound transport system permease small subunit
LIPSFVTRVLDRLLALTHAISRASVWIAGAFMLATTVLVASEVILRKLGSAMISGASEIGGYMLAICSVWAFSYTLLQRSHIRFDILYAQLGPRARAVADLIGLLALGVFACVITEHSYAVLATSISFNAHSVSSLSTPLWLPQSVWVGGLVFLCWTCGILALRVLVALLQGDYEMVASLAGTRLTKEEIEAEAGDILDEIAAPQPAEKG